MTTWPWSSIHNYVDEQGKEQVLKTWREDPVGDYGRGWDWQKGRYSAPLRSALRTGCVAHYDPWYGHAAHGGSGDGR